MKDEIPKQPFPAYNLDETGDETNAKWSNLYRIAEDGENQCSAFWPLLIVFIALAVLLIFEVSLLRYRELAIISQNNRLEELNQKVNAQDELILGLRKDLQSLAPPHPAAAAILKGFFNEDDKDKTDPAQLFKSQ